jgi:hypothetical protein
MKAANFSLSFKYQSAGVGAEYTSAFFFQEASR